MKKATLVFILLYTSALNSMEVEHNHYVGMGMQDLPKEIQSLIIAHLNTGDTVKNVIKAIIRISKTNKTFSTLIKDMYGNQKGFTALIHELANNFHTNPSHIAKQFNTPISKNYLTLGNALLGIISSHNTQSVKDIIEQGADINYYDENNKSTALAYAERYGNADIVKLLRKEKEELLEMEIDK